MKQQLLLSLLLLCALQGCDVSNNNGNSNTGLDLDNDGSGDDGDPVVVDLPIAFIERPTPYEAEDPDDDASPQVLVPFDVFDPSHFNPGARLVIKTRASASASARVITDEVFPAEIEGEDAPLYDVKDLAVNADGTKLVFAMRAPEIEDADEDEQPTWNIWEYDLSSDMLRRVISSNLLAEAGQDIMPSYLPDDRIVFSSTRQRTSKSISLDQSRPQFTYVTERDGDEYAYTLHIIDEDGNISQISYGKGDDFYPTILSDGRILFLRGDDTSNTNRDRLSLYTIHPDGSDLSPYYGFHSPSGSGDEGQGALIKPLQMPDGRILVSFRERLSQTHGGDIVAIDTQNFIDLNKPTYANVGGVGPAETSLSFGTVVIEAQSEHGTFNSAYPLFDGTGRFIVAWQPCLVEGYDFSPRIYTQSSVDAEGNNVYTLINANGELVNTGGSVLAAGQTAVTIEEDEVITLPCLAESIDNPFIELADPQFGIWIYDPVTQTQAPVVTANSIGTLYTEAVVFEPKTPADYIPGAATDPERAELTEQSVGIVNIKSIYSMDGEDGVADGIPAMADPLRTPTDERPVRFIRILEHANMPHDDDYDIDMALVRGRNGQPGKGIIGYAQVHPDGSALFKVPANVAFTMEFVDANGRRLRGSLEGRHRNWLNVVPGEIRTCNGCHNANSEEPHGRYNAEPPTANIGALAETPFPNTSLRDPLGTPYSAMPQVGETMAEYFTRVKLADPAVETDPRDLSLDIVFTDEWTDPASGAAVGADISLVFAAPEASGPDNLHTLPPVLIGDCLESWSFLCRTVIDYPDHIQPIWEWPRTISQAGVDVDITCINCHSAADRDGNPQIPEPVDTVQLSFENVVSPLDNNMVFLKGYDELFAAGDPVLEVNPDTGLIQIQQIPLVIDGEIQYQMVQQTDDMGTPLFEAVDQTTLEDLCVPQSTDDPNIVLNVDANDANIPCMTFVYYTDEFGELVLDGAGNPIPIPLFENNTQGRYLTTAQGANSTQNARFFAVFEAGAAHEGYLSPAEIKLISEWLDLGGQYYNEIFKALDD
ncbi:hypothetical protein TDB9533_01834 [Thalassocella blandensis]|nr:hypothetical protein TDB9533_01834 [Thalassocella blandensis]